MANDARIPKTMNVVPQVAGLDNFQQDWAKVAKTVNDGVNDIKKSLAQISGKTNVSLSKTSQVAAQLGSNIRNVGNVFAGSLGAVSSFGQGIVNVGKVIEKTGQITRRLAFDFERVGWSLTTFVTLPLIAAGISAVKAGAQFEASLKKVQTLVGVNEEIVRKWGQQILDIAPKLGQLPTEMAEGLFYAASGFGSLAGQAPTMDVLIAATKAAALGLGEVGDIARAVTGVMNVYGDELSNATEATALLFFTAREGNFELDQLVGSLGGVLGIAKELNVSFADIGAGIATLTRGLLSPSEAVTVLRSALLNLAAPSKAHKELLESVGYTYESLTKKLGKDGLLGVMLDLRGKFGDEQFLDFFGIRAIRGALSITGELADDYAQIADEMGVTTKRTYDDMADYASQASRRSLGAWTGALSEQSRIVSEFEKAYLEATDTVLFKWDQLMGNLQSLGIRGIFNVYNKEIKDFLDRVNLALERLQIFVTENKQTVRLLVKIAAGLVAIGPGMVIMGRVLSMFSIWFTVAGRGLIVVGSLIRGFASLIGFGGRLLSAFITPVVKGLSLIAVWGYKAAVVIGTQLTRAVAFGFGSLINYTLRATAFMIDFGAAIVSVIATRGISAIITIGGATANLGLSLAGIGTSAVSAFGALGAAAAAALGPIAGVTAAVVLVGTALLALVGMGKQLADSLIAGFKSIGETLKKFVGDVLTRFFRESGKTAGDWGTGLMKAFSQGIIDGIAYLVDSLTAVGEVIRYWLMPGSPPRLLPDLDKWGQGAMEAYLEGWGKADFSVLLDLGSTIKDYLTAIAKDADDDKTKKAIAQVVLGSRDEIAKAINEIKDLGKASEKAIQDVFSALGTTTPTLQGYIRATLALAAANEEVAKAQEKVNAITKKYDDMLAPLSEQLKAIERERNNVENATRLEELRKILRDPFADAQTKRFAQLSIAEIEIKQTQTAIEAERDPALAAANAQLAIAQENQALAEKQLEYWQGLIDLTIDNASLLEEILKAAKKLAEKMDKLADAFTAGQGLDKPETLRSKLAPLDFEPPDIIGPIDAKLRVLQAKLDLLKRTWAATFADMKQRALVFIRESGILNLWENVKKTYDENVAPIVNASIAEGERTWGNIKLLAQDIQTYFGDDWTAFKDNLAAMATTLVKDLPGGITSFSDAINNELIPAIRDALPEIDKWLEKAQASPLNGKATEAFADPRFQQFSQILAPFGPATSVSALMGVQWLERTLPKVGDAIRGAFDPWWAGVKERFSGFSWTELLNSISTGAEGGDPLLKFINGIIGAFTISDETKAQFATANENLKKQFIDTFTITEEDKETFRTTWASWGEEFRTTIGSFWDESFSGLFSPETNTKIENFGKGLIEMFTSTEIPIWNAGDALHGYAGNLGGVGEGTFAVTGLVNTLSTAWENGKTKVTALSDYLNTTGSLALTKIKNRVTTLISDALEPFKTIIDEIRGLWEEIVTVINVRVIPAFTGLLTKVSEALTGVLLQFKTWVEDVATYLDETWSKAMETAAGWYDTWKQKIEILLTPLNAFVDAVVKLVTWLGKLPKAIFDRIANSGSVPNYGQNGDGTTPKPGEDPGTPIVESAPITGPNVVIPQSLRSLLTQMGGIAMVIPANANVAMAGGVVLSFGNVVINNDMDMATFTAKVRRVVVDSLS